jgi:hypothetical protein
MHKVGGKGVINLLSCGYSHDLFLKILEVLVLPGDGILLDFGSVFFLKG